MSESNFSFDFNNNDTEGKNPNRVISFLVSSQGEFAPKDQAQVLSNEKIIESKEVGVFPLGNLVSTKTSHLQPLQLSSGNQNATTAESDLDQPQGPVDTLEKAEPQSQDPRVFKDEGFSSASSHLQYFSVSDEHPENSPCQQVQSPAPENKDLLEVAEAPCLRDPALQMSPPSTLNNPFALRIEENAEQSFETAHFQSPSSQSARNVSFQDAGFEVIDLRGPVLQQFQHHIIINDEGRIDRQPLPHFGVSHTQQVQFVDPEIEVALISLDLHLSFAITIIQFFLWCPTCKEMMKTQCDSS